MGSGTPPKFVCKSEQRYARAGFAEQAITEFERVLAKNNQFRGAYHSLGAAYLSGRGEAAFAEAAAEFREELRLYPGDLLSHSQLGYIAPSQHNYSEAERELTQSVPLDPRNPNLYLSLDRLYSETSRPSEAEAALRKSIELTSEVSQNHYQVQQAHYLVGRLLLRSGRTAEGQAEMQTSDQLLKLNLATNQGKSMTAPGASSPSAMATRREAADPEVSQRLASLEQRLGPAIADSYNNLGVISASRNDLNGAVEDFSKAAEWNPTLDGLDYNWGRAAFASNQYGKAVDPLDRYLHAHPDDAWARAALGSSYFQTHKYAEAVATLQPLEAQILTIPQLASWYAMSLVKSGDVSRATAWLKGLNIADPSLAGVYYELGKVQCERGDIKQAIQNRAE